MNDTVKRERIVVSTENPEFPYLMIPYADLAKVEAALRAHDISYWPDEWTYSSDEEPEVVFVNFPQGADAVRIQAALDAIG